MDLENYSEKIGLTIGICSIIWLLRIYIIISQGYRYVAYESNLIVIYFEIYFLVLGIIILSVMLYRKF